MNCRFGRRRLGHHEVSQQIDQQRLLVSSVIQDSIG